MEIPNKFSIGQRVKVNLKEDGFFYGIIEGVAFNKGRIFYCLFSGGTRLYTIEESVIEKVE